MYKKNQHIHFVGIGGIGMSGIAELLLNLGYRVSGSDARRSESTERLASFGARVCYGHDGKHLTDADVVVVSSAIKRDNPEVLAAHERSIQVIPRAEMLAELMRLKYGIAVAGAHGKTTTTSLVAAVLEQGGVNPTVVVGGRLLKTNANAVLGSGEFLVAEADESDGSFLNLPPTIAVVTNIDREHLDFYPDIDAIKEAFVAFLNKVPFYGVNIICLDDENVQSIMPRIKKRVLTYGRATQADLQASDIQLSSASTAYSVYLKEKKLGAIRLGVPGIHNVLNSLAAVGVGLELGIPFKVIKKGLGDFRGIQRRIQLRGKKSGITWIDDYGHHPTEIKMTLKAVRQITQGRVVVLFQPHRYTRTYHLFSEFMTAFYDADVLVVADIYPASEAPIPEVNSRRFCEGLKEYGHKDVTYIPELKTAEQHLADTLVPGDVLLTLGAGDIWRSGEAILKLLGSKKAGRKDAVAKE